MHLHLLHFVKVTHKNKQWFIDIAQNIRHLIPHHAHIKGVEPSPCRWQCKQRSETYKLSTRNKYEDLYSAIKLPF